MANGESREQRKNIVLCSDGTGQTGARVGGTNVWKIRMGVDRHDHLKDSSLRRQIMFYDAGVGTSKLSVKRMLGGAFGYGLSANMRTLYTNLCKTYQKGDRIYIFGFSRGAFTARSLAGMISEVGVIDGRRNNEELEGLVKEAYKVYRASPGGENFPQPYDPPSESSTPSRPIEAFRKQNREIIRDAPIHFVGVWDTVDAYGMPVDELRDLIYKGILYRIRRPHNDGLTSKMKYAYQAIAIDEDRRTFAPTMYNEEQAKKCGVTCDQVWFAGAHSNVGGGYPRQGLSDVALYWMMTKAMEAKAPGERGLRFTQEAIDEARRDMDGNSTLYDQRSGGGAIWRYLPRNIGDLCGDEKRANTPVRIHVSAMDRMRLATADYGPVTLPIDFEVVGTDPADQERVEAFNRCLQAPEARQARDNAAKPAWKEIEGRRWDYRIFLIALTLVVALVVWLMIGREGAVETYRTYSPTHWLLVKIGDLMPGIEAPAVTAWSWISKAAVALSPGLVKYATTALFKLPEGVIGIILLAWILMSRKKRRVARLKHKGLDLWRKCFAKGGG